MVNTTRKNQASWIQAIGLGFLALFLVLFMVPTKANAFALFNGDGNDGYFLSLTNDSTNVRVVPVTIYDNHPKAQKAKKFVEWVDVKVNYAKFPTGTALPQVDGGEDGREGWLDKLEDEVGKDKLRKIDDDDMLGWTFPAFAGNDVAETYNASQLDLDRAQWVADTLVHDFNGAISMVHGAIQKYGDKDLENMSDNQFANMIRKIANAGYTATNGNTGYIDYHGVKFKVTKATNVEPVKGVSEDAYVKLTLVEAKSSFPSNLSKSFIQEVPKGYRSGQDLHNALSGTFKNIVEDKKDLKTLNWKLIALQSNANWSANNVTFTNVGSITSMNKLEQAITDLSSNTLTWLRQTLGLYSASDLILNGGTRGTDSYYKGIMPKVWMDSAGVLHWISYAIAWMLIIGAIVKLLVQRNIAAINPSERVDMINGIKNLMIVGFALSIFDVTFAGITEMNEVIVNMLAGSGTGVEQFGKAPVGSGMLASIIVGSVFFCLDLYFNFFYISRALMVAILYAVGPLYVASIAFGEKYRQIFGNYVKEIVGNVFVQSFQAILVVFFAGISIMGSLRTIETLVLLFCFIPMTRFFKESIGASSSASDAMTSTALGATTGAMAGIISSQFMKNRKNKGGAKDNKAVEGGSDIRTKSGSSFGGGGEKTKASVGSMIGHTAKAGGKGVGAVALATVGAGLVAGGAATGMHGASQLGGMAIGGGFNAAGSGAKSGGNVVRDGVAMGQNRRNEKQAAAYNNHLQHGNRFDAKGNLTGDISPDGTVSHDTTGSPMAQSIDNQIDGSAVHSFDKSAFANETGITSMRDLDNVGDEMEVGTNYVDGQGFMNGHRTGLSGSNYERNMGDMVNAFKNQNTSQMDKYRAKGINDVKVDRNSGRVSMVVDKKKAGIKDFSSSGDSMKLHRYTHGRSSDKTFRGDSNPLKDLTDTRL